MDAELEKLFSLTKGEITEIISQLTASEVMEFADVLGGENDE